MATTCRLFNASHRWTGLSVSQVPLSSARKAFSVEGCNAGPLRLNLRRSMAAKASSDAPVEVAVTATEKPPLVLKAPPGVGAFRIGPGQTLDVATASVQVVLRLGSSAFTLSNVNQYKRPAQPIILYEFEGCPFCRKVREVVSILDLDVLYYPCPQGGPTFRPKAVEMSGKKQFPFLVDPNTGRQMLESDDIIKYLVTEYGDGKVIGWKLVEAESGLRIKCEVEHKDLNAGLELFNRIINIAEVEGHPPDLYLESCNLASIVMPSHSIGEANTMLLEREQHVLHTRAATGPGGGVLDKPPPVVERPTPGRESEFDLGVVRKKKQSPPYRVLLHNDNFNRREYVVQVLMKVIPSMTVDLAVNIMQEAHVNGMAVVIVCGQDEAEDLCMQLRTNGLVSSIEPASS